MLSNFEKVQKFVNEINYITSPQLQEFVVHLLLNANDYFFTTPASTSGKYHPYFAKGEGGLVAHTRCVAFFAKCNAESFDLSENETNLLIVAAIAHDIKNKEKKKMPNIRNGTILNLRMIMLSTFGNNILTFCHMMM